MTTLYRKHRPNNFSEVVNQNHVKLTLTHEIASGKIAQAYLFCGPRGIGKTTLARVFAKAINCETRKEGKFEPCNKCPSCDEINEFRSFDIAEIDAASHTGVDNVRENIIASSRVAPSRLKYKVFIIDEVHMLSTSSFNALLKTIEEPPPHIVFILCTTEIHKVPTTIISRCQRFDLKKISVPDIVRKLQYIAKAEDLKISDNILEEIARRSEGHMRDAESLLGQLLAVGGKEITEEEAGLVIPRSDINEIISLVAFLNKRDSVGAIRLINRLAEEGVELKNFAANLIEILRRLMLAKINPALVENLSLELGEQVEIELTAAGKDLAIERIIFMIEELVLARNEIKNSFITQLPLELAVVRIGLYSGAKDSPAPASPSFSNRTDAYPSPKPQDAARGAGPRPSAPSAIAIDKVMEKWNEVLARVKKYNHSLSFVLKVCEPRSVSENSLCLAFKYKFHKDRIDNPSIKSIVEKTLKEVYNLPLRVEVIIDESMEIGQESDRREGEKESNGGQAGKSAKDAGAGAAGNDMMANLLKTFGGKIIE
ncbi:MAG: DNA polymerase III subunit gamma/tau [Patescibacteria group bacterium]|jgi:DNA polymerase-3 subunit gamma/tau